MRHVGLAMTLATVLLTAACTTPTQPPAAPTTSAPAPERVTVPDVLGMSWLEVRDTLEDADLIPKIIGDDGVAIRQTPDSGTSFETGTTVIVTLGEAADPTPTPVVLTDDQRYQEQYTARGGTGDPAGSSRLAQSACDNLRQHYSADPTTAVSALIENSASRDPLGIEIYCPEFLPALATAQSGFYDGTHVVGQDIAPGTYTTIVNPGATGTHDCYWERTTSGGGTIDNDFVTLAPQGVTVTIAAGEGFVSEGCGAWLPS